MRLLRLERASFGTLNVTAPLGFDAGINLVAAPNQRGKTTLLVLLEWLLYGVPPRGSKRNASLVLEWSPWSGEAPSAALVVRPERDGWPDEIRIEAWFDDFKLKLTGLDSGEDISPRVRVHNNGTWDLGWQLTSLTRTAFSASLLAQQGRMESVLDEADLRKALLSDLSELVEDPERASLEAALSALDKPAFTMGEDQPAPVQMPSLLRRADEQYRMQRGHRESQQEEFNAAEKLLIACSEAEQQQSREQAKLLKMQAGLQDKQLAAACWRYGRLQTVKARLDAWQDKLRDQPWLAEFPAQLETDAEAQYAAWRQLGEVIEDRRRRLQQLERSHSNIDHQLKQNAKLVPLIPRRQQLSAVSASIESANKDLSAAEDDRREHGEAADPATRQRFEQLDSKLEPHRPYIEALKYWHERHSAARAARAEAEQRQAELQREILPGRPWQVYAVIVLLLLAIAAAIFGPNYITPAYFAYIAAALAVALAAWLASSAAGLIRTSDKAAVELERVLQPKLAELLEADAQLDADKKLLREHHGISAEDWDSVLQALPQYRELHYRLESYARACHGRDAAQRRIEAAWQSLHELAAGAASPPPHPDLAWLASLLETLDGLRTAQEQAANQHATLKEEEREISRHESERAEQLRRLAKLLSPLGLDALAESDPPKAITRCGEFAAMSRDYKKQLAEYNNERDKLAALDMDQEEFNAAFNRLEPAQQSRIAGLVSDETAWDKLAWDLRGIRDELEQAATTLNQAAARAAQLREQVAAHSAVLTELPRARESEAAALERLQTVRRWNRALELLGGTLREIHARRKSNLAPKLNTALQQILEAAPLAGVTRAGLGPDLELRLELAGAPPGLAGADAVMRLSAGARQQLALAVRMAVARTLAETASLPVLLDEPLSDLDDARSADWLKYLAKVAEGSQVLLTSCHEQQYAWLAEQTGVNLHPIELPSAL